VPNGERADACFRPAVQAVTCDERTVIRRGKRTARGNGVDDPTGADSISEGSARVACVTDNPVSVYFTAYFTGTFDECPVRREQSIRGAIESLYP
jgi:hypothetical protein